MNVENLTGSDLPPVEKPAADGGSSSKFGSRMLWAQFIIFFFGLGLLVLVVYKIGFQTIFDALSSIGWGFLLIVALNGARHLIRAWCIYLAIPPQHRSFKFRYALAARFGGEAVSFLTFTGPLLGEATKAALLKKRLPLSHGVTAVVMDNILYDISVALMILGGAVVMLYVYGSDDKVIRFVLFGIALLASLSVIAVFAAAKARIKPLSRLLEILAARKWLPRFVQSKQKHILELEGNVHEFYTNRRATFFSIFGLIVSSHVLSVCEVYAALFLLGYVSYPSTAYIIESLTKVINFAFGFVPGTVGVYEGGNGIILRALGYTTAVGVTLALVRRGAILFWTFVGLIVLLWRGVLRGTKHLAERES